ncbi:MAG: DegT/DnrJ/EryC1/StrS family aminotransferase [Anaerolineae bacterium]|nr:DegT/DnrJ/EryC1/StrS family aminotransferase [Anaerolineae bacterium]
MKTEIQLVPPATQAATTPDNDYISLAPPDITEMEIAEVVDTLCSGWITTGPKTKRFEDQFAAYVGSEAALAVSSCTAALHLALVALGIGPGDEVITTPMTFASTVHVIVQVGATPILVDVDPQTLNLDPQWVADAITPRTKAILPVHYGGHPVDMAAIMQLAHEHGLAVIEDAAHALPAAFDGRIIGSAPNLTAFSFYATKTLTTAEGGMLTGSAELVEKARAFSLHGMSRDAWKRYGQHGAWYYEVVCCGYKYNMTDIQAALGLVQLSRLDAMYDARRRAVALYDEAFTSWEELVRPVELPGVQHAWHLYVLRLNQERLRINRDQFIQELTARHIGTSVHFIPVHLHPYYRATYGWQPEDFPVALREYQRMISLPLHSSHPEANYRRVIAAVQDVVKLYRK